MINFRNRKISKNLRIGIKKKGRNLNGFFFPLHFPSFFVILAIRSSWKRDGKNLSGMRIKKGFVSRTRFREARKILKIYSRRNRVDCKCLKFSPGKSGYGALRAAAAAAAVAENKSRSNYRIKRSRSLADN